MGETINTQHYPNWEIIEIELSSMSAKCAMKLSLSMSVTYTTKLLRNIACLYIAQFIKTSKLPSTCWKFPKLMEIDEIKSKRRKFNCKCCNMKMRPVVMNLRLNCVAFSTTSPLYSPTLSIYATCNELKMCNGPDPPGVVTVTMNSFEDYPLALQITPNFFNVLHPRSHAVRKLPMRSSIIRFLHIKHA